MGMEVNPLLVQKLGLEAEAEVGAVGQKKVKIKVDRPRKVREV